MHLSGLRAAKKTPPAFEIQAGQFWVSFENRAARNPLGIAGR
jgi:hypothetical protein